MPDLRDPGQKQRVIWVLAIGLLLLVVGGRAWHGHQQSLRGDELKRVTWLSDQVRLAQRALLTHDPSLNTRLAAGLSTENSHLHLSPALLAPFEAVRARLRESLEVGPASHQTQRVLDGLARDMNGFSTRFQRHLSRQGTVEARLDYALIALETLLVGLGLIMLASGRNEFESGRRRFAHSPNPRMILDEKGIILGVNEAAEKRLGIMQAALCGKPIGSLVQGDEDFRLQSLARIQQGSQSEFILPLRTASGAIWESRVRTHVSPSIPGMGRRIDCFLYAPVDDLFRAHLDELPIPVFCLDLEGRYVEASDALLRLLHCDGLEDLNRLGHDAALIGEVFRERNKAATITDVPHVLIDGLGRALEVTLTLRVDEEIGGTVVRGVFADASEVETTRRELARKEREFRALYDGTPVMLYAVDARGLMTNVNQFWLDAMGYEREEVIGEASMQHYVFDGEKLDFLNNVIQAKPGTRTVAVRLRTKSGRIIEGALDFSRKLDSQGKFAGATCCVVDQTIEREIARERDRLAQRLSTVAANDSPTEAAAS